MGVNLHIFWMKVKDFLVLFGYEAGWTEETVRKPIDHAWQ
jgi:hypothetical protein